MDDEKYSIEDVLKNLDIAYDDITQVSDGSYGYLFLLVSNIDEAGKETLRGLDFTNMFDDLWYKRGEELRDISRSRLIEIIENLYGEKSKQRENIFLSDNIKLWQSIVSQFCNILKMNISNNNFKATVEDIETACRFNGFLCANKGQLKDFLSGVNEFLNPVVIDEKFKAIASDLKNYRALRDYYVHDLEKNEKDGDEKIKNVRNIHNSIIGKPFPNTQFDFMSLQETILVDCENALGRINLLISRS